MKKIFSVLLLIALFIPLLSSCQAYGRRALKIGVSVSCEVGLDVVTAAVITEGDGSIHSCQIRGESYDYDFDPEDLLTPDGEWDTPIIDLSLSSASDEPAPPIITVTSFDASSNSEVASFEEAVKGKTLADIQGMPTDDGLDSLTNFMIDAVKRALSTEHIVNFRSGSDLSVGVSYMPTVTASWSEDGRPSVTVSANVGAAALDSGDTVKCAVIDSFEVTFGGFLVKDGENLSDLFSYKGTKLEQRDAYGMVAWAGAIAEWYAQAQTYANTAIGKRLDEVITLPEYNVAGCTMYVAGYKPAIIEAVMNASDNK